MAAVLKEVTVNWVILGCIILIVELLVDKLNPTTQTNILCLQLSDLMIIKVFIENSASLITYSTH